MRIAALANKTCILAALTLLGVTFFSAQIVCGQGLNMTALNPPNSSPGSTIPLGVNKTGAVVGSYTDSSTGNKAGFLYSAKKYTVINPPTAATWSRASGINDTGEIVGDFQTSDTRFHGFTYSAGTYTTYDETPSESCGLFGINSTGDLAGSVGNGTTPRAFVNIKGVKTEFTPSGGVSAWAYAINTADEAVGTYYDSSGNAHGFSWLSGTITEIKYPGATQTLALGISDTGEITGTYILPSGLTYGFTLIKKVYTTTDFAFTGGVNKTGSYDGYYWGVDGVSTAYLAKPQKFTLTPVSVPNSQQAQLFAINNSGVSVGTYVDSGGTRHGLMLSGGVVTNIDDTKGAYTICFGINTSNQIVGDYFDTSGNPHGFMYSGGTYTDIPGPASALSSDATGINDNGDVAGDYFDGGARTHYGFLLKGGTYTTLNPSGSRNTFSGGISATDEITFFWVDSAGYVQSSLYTNSTKKFTSTNVVGAASSYAHSINKTGETVFGIYDPYSVGHGGIKKGANYYVFDLPQGTGAVATGINDTGEFVGYYTPTGQTVPQAFQGH